MKKILLLISLLYSSYSASYGQNSDITDSTFNHWSLDAGIGSSMPYNKVSSGYKLPSLGSLGGTIGIRYMLNEYFGLRGDFGYNSFRNRNSTPHFSANEYRIALQGVINFGHLLHFEEWTKTLNLLAHAGVGAGIVEYNSRNFNDKVGNTIMGFTGQVKISPRFTLNIDGSVFTNAKQSLAFDGAASSRNKLAFVFSETIGISYYFGKKKTHADWHIRKSHNDVLEARITQLKSEVKQKNEIAQRIQDKVESMNKKIDNLHEQIQVPVSPNYNENIEAQLIRDGYADIYFDFGSAKIDKTAYNAINLLKNYMMKHPEVKINLAGYADKTGPKKYNRKLSKLRSQAVAKTLIEAGIDNSRIHAEGKGEDTHIITNSPQALQSARRVSVSFQ